MELQDGNSAPKGSTKYSDSDVLYYNKLTSELPDLKIAPVATPDEIDDNNFSFLQYKKVKSIFPDMPDVASPTDITPEYMAAAIKANESSNFNNLFERVKDDPYIVKQGYKPKKWNDAVSEDEKYTLEHKFAYNTKQEFTKLGEAVGIKYTDVSPDKVNPNDVLSTINYELGDQIVNKIVENNNKETLTQYNTGVTELNDPSLTIANSIDEVDPKKLSYVQYKKQRQSIPELPDVASPEDITPEHMAKLQVAMAAKTWNSIFEQVKDNPEVIALGYKPKKYDDVVSPKEQEFLEETLKNKLNKKYADNAKSLGMKFTPVEKLWDFNSGITDPIDNAINKKNSDEWLANTNKLAKQYGIAPFKSVEDYDKTHVAKWDAYNEKQLKKNNSTIAELNSKLPEKERFPIVKTNEEYQFIFPKLKAAAAKVQAAEVKKFEAKQVKEASKSVAEYNRATGSRYTLPKTKGEAKLVLEKINKEISTYKSKKKAVEDWNANPTGNPYASLGLPRPVDAQYKPYEVRGARISGNEIVYPAKKITPAEEKAARDAIKASISDLDKNPKGKLIIENLKQLDPSLVPTPPAANVKSKPFTSPAQTYTVTVTDANRPYQEQPSYQVDRNLSYVLSEKYTKDLEEQGNLVNISIRDLEKKVNDYTLNYEDLKNKISKEGYTEENNKELDRLDALRDNLSKENNTISALSTINKVYAGHVFDAKATRGSLTGAAWNNFVTGGADILNGLYSLDKTIGLGFSNPLKPIGYNFINKNIKGLFQGDEVVRNIDEQQKKDIIEFASQLKSASSIFKANVSDEYVQKKTEEGGIGSILMQLPRSVPAMALGMVPALQPVAAEIFALQILGEKFPAALNDPRNANLTINQLLATIVPNAMVQGYIENLSMKAFGKSMAWVGLTKKAGSEIAAKELISAKMFSDFIQSGVNKVGLNKYISENFVKTAGILLEQTTIEGFENVLQDVTNNVNNSIVNNILKEKHFDVNNSVNAYWESLKSGMVGGFVFGAVSTAGHTIVNKIKVESINNKQFELVRQALQDPAIMKSWVTDIKLKIANKEITLDEGKAYLAGIKEFGYIASKIPTDISVENQKKSFDLIKERMAIEQEVKGKDENLTLAKKQRITEINKQLQAISLETVAAVDNGQVVTTNADGTVTTTPAKTIDGVGTYEFEGKLYIEDKDGNIKLEDGTSVTDQKTIDKIKKEGIFNEIAPTAAQEVETLKEGSVGVGVENPALRDVESTTKALEGVEKTNKTENTNTDIGYHGTPYNYDSFDASKIGTGEGASKRGKGIYFMRSKRLAPYFANINSEDAPIHFGKGKSKVDKNKIDPRIFEVSGLDNLKLKKGSPRDVSNWASRQQEFVGQGFDGFETTSGEITVFPESIKKVKIDSKNTIGEFIGKNADIEFREWTTEQGKENKVVSESYHKAKTDNSNPELVKAVESLLSAKETTKAETTSAQKVETLRAAEQAELDEKIPNAEQYRVDGKVDRTKLTNDADIKAFDEVYAKYDKLITPLLEKTASTDRTVFGNLPVGIKASEGAPTSKVHAPLFTAAKTALKVLNKLFPNTEIHFHENNSDFQKVLDATANGKEASKTDGNFAYVKDSNGKYTVRIDINLANPKASVTTVIHEAGHPILLSAFGENPDYFKYLKSQVAKSVGFTKNAKLKEFIKAYDDAEQPEEYLVQLGGILKEGEKIEPNVFRRIAEAINKIFLKITDGKFKPFENVKNSNDAVRYFASLVDAIRTGDLGDIKLSSQSQKSGAPEMGSKQSRGGLTATDMKSMTVADNGDLLFFHYGDIKGSKVDARKGTPKAYTTDKRVYTANYYYTNESDREGMVGGKVNVVRVPADKVYNFNKDVLGLFDEAKKNSEAHSKGQAFSPNRQADFIAQLAAKNGFDMVVAKWGNGYRAESPKALSVDAALTKQMRTNGSLSTAAVDEKLNQDIYNAAASKANGNSEKYRSAFYGIKDITAKDIMEHPILSRGIPKKLADKYNAGQIKSKQSTSGVDIENINNIGVSGVINSNGIKSKSSISSGVVKRFPVNKNVKVQEDVPMANFNGKVSNLIESDRMTGGWIGDEKGNVLYRFYGGVFYPIITGKWWASRNDRKAKAIANNGNKNRDADGYVYCTPMIGSNKQHMSNIDMLSVTVELMKSDVIDKKSMVRKEDVVTSIDKAFNRKSLKNKRSVLRDVLKKSNNIGQIFDELEYVLFQDGTKVLGRDGNPMLDEYGKPLSNFSFKERLAIVNTILGDPKVKDVRFPSAGSITDAAKRFEEPITAKSKTIGDAVTVMRTKGTLMYKKTDKTDKFYHKSYPVEIYAVDENGNPAEIEVYVLDGAYGMMNTFPSLTQSSGKVFTYVDYAAKHKSETFAIAQYNRTAKMSSAAGEISAGIKSKQSLKAGDKVKIEGVSVTIPSEAQQDLLKQERTAKSYFDEKVRLMKPSPLSKEEIKSILDRDDTAILTGTNPDGNAVDDKTNKLLNKKAEDWLKENGYTYHQVTGKYGQTESSFLVEGMTGDVALEFAKIFKQDSVLQSEGLIYREGTIEKRIADADVFGVDVAEPEADYVSAIKTNTGEVVGFQIGLDLGNKVQYEVKSKQSRTASGAEVIDGFYSNTENALGQVKQEKMSGSQWDAQLLSRGGNKEEMKWTGLTNWLSQQQGSVSKADIQNYLKENRIQVVEVVKSDRPFKEIKNKMFSLGNEWEEVYGGVEAKKSNKDGDRFNLRINGVEYQRDFSYPDAKSYIEANATENPEKSRSKFSQLQLEGEKENYKEVLVTMPSKGLPEGYEVKKTVLSNGDVVYRANGDGLSSPHKTYQEAENELKERAKEFYGTGGLGGAKFKSSHFDEPNILVHLRMNTRTDSDGNKVLFLEEVQSDWGQEGKKQGFEKPEDTQAIEELENEKQKVLDSSKSYQLLNENTEGNLSVEVFDAIQQKATNMIDNQYSTEESRKKRFLKEIEDTLRYWSNSRYAVPKMNQEELSNFYDVYIKELENNSKKISGYSPSYQLASLENKIEDINKKIYDFSAKKGVKKAPFVMDTKAWTKLGLKVALKEAVRQGAKKIAWTTGGQQNNRYDLSKQVDKIEIIKREGADSYRAKTYKNGYILEDQDYIAFDQLEGMFGKEIAKKVQEGESVFEGEGLAVGGKGMKDFYGSPTEGSLGIVGNAAKSLFKQEPKTVKINTTLYKENVTDSDFTIQHSIDITPELKAQVEEGQQIFSKQSKTNNALKDVESTAKALEGLDKSKIEEIYAGQLADNLSDEQFPSYEEYLSSWNTLNKERGFDNKLLSEAYHKAKADDSNPELVQAVEELLSDKSKVYRILNDTFNQEAKKTKIDKLDVKALARKVVDIVKSSKLYEQTDDIERENAIIDFLKTKGIVQKRVIEPRNKNIISVNEVTALKDQIRLEIKAANDGAKSIEDAVKKIGEIIRGLAKGKKISITSAKALINKFSNMNTANKDSVNSVLDYASKIFNDAEYADKVSQVRALNAAMKRAARNSAIPPATRSIALSFAKINPEAVSDIDAHLEAANKIKDATLGVKENGERIRKAIDINAMADYLNRAMAEQETYDAKNPKTTRVVEPLDEEKTLEYFAAMHDSLLQAAKAVAPSAVLTDAEMAQLKNFLKLSIDDFETMAEKVAAVEALDHFVKNADMGKIPFLLNNQQVKSNINKGVKVILPKLKSVSLMWFSEQKAKIRGWVYNKFMYGNAIDYNKELAYFMNQAIRRIDSLIGNFKTYDVFNKTFKAMASGYAKYIFKIKSMEANVIFQKVLASFYGDMEQAVKHCYKMTMYKLQLEYESNIGNIEVIPAIKHLNETLKSGNLTEKDKDELRKLIDKFSTIDATTGEQNIDTNKIWDSFSEVEQQAAISLAKLYEKLRPYAQHVAVSLRGEVFNPRVNYMMLNVISAGQPLSTLPPSASQVLTDRGSTKAQTINPRDGKPHPISLDPYNTFNTANRDIMMDYCLLNPIKTVEAIFEKLVEDTAGDKKANDVAKSLKLIFDEITQSVINRSIVNSDEISAGIISYIKKVGARFMLSRPSKAVGEFSGNLSYAITRYGENIIEGMKNNSLQRNFKLTTVMEVLNSYSLDRLYPHKGESGAFLDPNSFDIDVRDKKHFIDGFSNAAQIAYYNSLLWAQKGGEAISDALMSVPDLSIGRFAWEGTFRLTFKKETGLDIDMDKIEAKDYDYLEEYKDALEKATTEADRVVAEIANTKNPFVGIAKEAAWRGKMSEILIINNYMTSFTKTENQNGIDAAYAVAYGGKVSRIEGIRTIAAILVRSGVYNVVKYKAQLGLLAIGYGLLNAVKGGDDSEEKRRRRAKAMVDYLTVENPKIQGSITGIKDNVNMGNALMTSDSKFIESAKKDAAPEESASHSFMKGMAQAGAGIILGRSSGGFYNSLVTAPLVEYANEKYIHPAISSEPYNKYRDGIMYSKVYDPNRPDPELNFIVDNSGAFQPFMRASISAVRTFYDRYGGELAKVEKKIEDHERGVLMSREDASRAKYDELVKRRDALKEKEKSMKSMTLKNIIVGVGTSTGILPAGKDIDFVADKIIKDESVPKDWNEIVEKFKESRNYDEGTMQRRNRNYKDMVLPEVFQKHVSQGYPIPAKKP